MAAAGDVVSGLGWLVLFAIRMLGRCWSSCHQELGEERSVGTCGLWPAQPPAGAPVFILTQESRAQELPSEDGVGGCRTEVARKRPPEN